MVEAGETVYGTTTGVNVQKTSPAPTGGEAKLAQAAGNAGRWGAHAAHYEPGVCRAAWAILLNGFATGSSSVTPYLADQMILWLNMAWDKSKKLHALLPAVETETSLSFADTVAPSVLQFETLGKYEVVGEEAVRRDYDFASGEILALLSNNAFTFAEAAVTVEKCKAMLELIQVATALDMEADKANPFIVGEAAEEVAQWSEKKAVIQRLRDLLKNSNIFVQPPSSIHPYVSLRASPDILGTAWEALKKATGVLEELINSHQSNPAVVGPWNMAGQSCGKVGPVAHFDTTRLFCTLSSLQQAMGMVALSLGERTQYRINADGWKVPELPGRRLLVWNEASVRGCLAPAQALHPSLARMSSCGGYDWAAPTAQLCSALAQLTQALAKVTVVNMAVSCAVIEDNMGDQAVSLLGSGCKDIFQRVQAHSFSSIKDTEVFSFQNLFESLRL